MDKKIGFKSRLSQFFRRFFPVKSLTDFPSGYIPNRIFLEQIDESPVLVVGDYKGRDYIPIKNKIGKAYLLDVFDSGIADKDFFVRQSLSEPTSFPNGYFKYVVIAEVIEHIWEDKKALEEVNRILSDNGKLLLGLPFYDDYADFHYHIYSPRTISLLLEYSGFSVESIGYRGLVLSAPNRIVAIASVLLSVVFGKKSLGIINNWLYKFHKAICRYKFPNCLFKNYGAYITAVKSFEQPPDPLKVQKENFS